MLFAGAKLINRDDARHWTRVRVGLLEDLVGVLTDVRNLLDRQPLRAQPAGVLVAPFVDSSR